MRVFQTMIRFFVVVGFFSSLALSAAWSAGGSDDANDAASGSPAFIAAKSAVTAEKYHDAVPMLEAVTKVEPKNADAWNLLGYSQRRIGRFEMALESYVKALALEASHLGANEYLGELYLKLGDVEKAEERLAVLDKACWLGCAEYTQLKKAIETWRTTGKVNW